MSIGAFFYQLIIGPLELIFGFIYSVSIGLIHNPGIAIIILSLCVNFLVLPLYKRADAIQNEANKKEKELAPIIKHIKTVFSGDERMFQLQAMYRVYGYSPFYSLRQTIPLLLQIPFFIAAYHMLSNLSTLRGVSFGPIADLGSPDKMLVIAGLSINVMPIIMTLFNVISGAIYSRGLPLKSKVQLYGIAIVFLVLLYNSPSGLVFYWTLNNVFSLVKNIIMKKHEQDPKRAPKPIKRGDLFYEDNRLLTFMCALTITILLGFLVASDVIASSPEDFINMLYYQNPSRYLWTSLTLSAGCFLVWGGIYYALLSQKGRRIMGFCSWLLLGALVLNYLAFGEGLGTVSKEFQFEESFFYSGMDMIKNVLILCLCLVLFYIMYKNKLVVCKAVSVILAIACVFMSVKNLIAINNGYKHASYVYNQNDLAELNLSRTEQNVVVIFLDRFIGLTLPYILEENPSLMEKMDGFTYYPNTVSYGTHTNTASVPLFGGYEYTPYMMNLRDSELLMDKHNEALCVMPVIFGESGFDVTVCDPKYAGYKWIPDLSIYDEYSYVDSYITTGHFCDEPEVMDAETTRTLEHNLFAYSVFRTSPLFMRPFLYDDGLYNVPDGMYTYQYMQVCDGVSVAYGYDKDFIDSYSVLENMSNMTSINDGQGGFVLLCNDTTHSDCLLDENGYVPSLEIDNTVIDSDTNRFGEYSDMFLSDVEIMQHYEIDAAAIYSLCRWFDYLRTEGIYDNTRIIVVSDHGYELNIYGEIEEQNNVLREAFNPLLLVKDFNATGFSVSNEFMTNADVPFIATNGVVENPVNPFTGNPITDENTDKSDGSVLVMDEPNWMVYYVNGTVFDPAYWYSVHGNVFSEESWEYLGVQ